MVFKMSNFMHKIWGRKSKKILHWAGEKFQSPFNYIHPCYHMNIMLMVWYLTIKRYIYWLLYIILNTNLITRSSTWIPMITPSYEWLWLDFPLIIIHKTSKINYICSAPNLAPTATELCQMYSCSGEHYNPSSYYSLSTTLLYYSR